MSAALGCELDLIDVGLDVEGGVQGIVEASSSKASTSTSKHITVDYSSKVRLLHLPKPDPVVSV